MLIVMEGVHETWDEAKATSKKPEKLINTEALLGKFIHLEQLPYHRTRDHIQPFWLSDLSTLVLTSALQLGHVTTSGFLSTLGAIIG